MVKLTRIYTGGGDKGRHARSAVGLGALPGRITVEIEVIIEVTD